MKVLRYRGGHRRGDSDRYSFAFFAVGALVVIAVAFFIGLQVGRVVEKNSAAKGNAAEKTALQRPAGENGVRPVAPSDLRREMSAFSEETARIPAVAPPPLPVPSAGDELRQTEKSSTFPEALSRKDPSPQPLIQGKPKADAPAVKEGKYSLQAGAMKSREKAEAVRKRLETAGYKAKVVRVPTPNRGDVYRVRVGPFDSREAASKAMKAIKSGMKIDVILLKG